MDKETFKKAEELFKIINEKEEMVALPHISLPVRNKIKGEIEDLKKELDELVRIKEQP